MALEEVLEEMETMFTNEHNISSRLTKELPEGKKVFEADFELKSEIFAFDLFPNYQDRETGWGTYYGPMSVFGNAKFPPLEEITPNMIEYWKRRSEVTSNPILAGRYADIVWDMSEIITGNKPSHELAERVIKSYIAIPVLSGKGLASVYVFDKLERALSLAFYLNNKELINECKNVLIAYEDKVGEDKWPGLWGRAFDNLVHNNKVILSEDEEKKIINDLENRLSRVTKAESLDLNAADRAVKALVKYYKKEKRADDLKKVISTLERAYSIVEENSSAMQVSHWLEGLSTLYKEHGFIDDSQRVLKRVEELGKRRYEELKPIPFEIPIDNTETEQIINELISGTNEEALTKIAITFVPLLSRAKEALLNDRQNLFMSMISTNRLDEEGNVIGKIGSLENDLDGHITNYISQLISISSLYLNLAISKALTKQNFLTDLKKFITSSAGIDKQRKSIVELGIDYHFSGNYIESTHLLIPQFEVAIRKIVQLLGDRITKENRYDNQIKEYITLNPLLRKEILRKVFREDTILYFRVLYVESNGLNLRNNICHGLTNPNHITKQISEAIIHSFLVLGITKKK